MMNQKWKQLGILLFFSLVLVGCSTAPIGFQATPEPVKISLKTDPATPVVGNMSIILEIKDQNGQPLTGAKVEVMADHTEMSGMTMSGPATEQDKGLYSIMADTSMSGTWKISVRVQKDDLDFSKDFEIIIP